MFGIRTGKESNFVVIDIDVDKGGEASWEEFIQGKEYWYVDEYVAALDEGRDHECSGTTGLHVVEIMMGLFESAAYGRRISLPQEDRSQPLLRWRREHGLAEPAPMPRDYYEWAAVEDERLAALTPPPGTASAPLR